MKVKNPYPEDQGFYVQLKIQTCSKCPAATIPYSSQLARFIGEYNSTTVQLFYSFLCFSCSSLILKTILSFMMPTMFLKKENMLITDKMKSPPEMAAAALL